LKLKIEIAIVLALSLGKSAIYSLVAILAALTSQKGLGGSKVTLNGSAASREWLDLTYQLLGTTFSLAPVALALYLLSSNGKPLELIALRFKPLGSNIGRGFLLAAAIGVPGLALYFTARQFGLSAQVVAADLGAHWWTVPTLLYAAVGASLLEEIVIVGYLFDRLKRLGVGTWGTILISSGIRGSYHLYQGFGGFIGNFVMGIVFGWVYKRYGRLMPLVIAHFILDAVSFVGYAYAKTIFSWL
jgi:membrane protease YdiL (CAAX protease family)